MSQQLQVGNPFPIGSIYISVNNTNPSTLFGGVWTQIKDKFLLASGDTYSNGSTGGESSHTLTVNEIPSHRHDFDRQKSYGSGTGYAGVNYGNSSGTDKGMYHTSYTGGGASHNNMPPYLAVTVWYRVS